MFPISDSGGIFLFAKLSTLEKQAFIFLSQKGWGMFSSLRQQVSKESLFAHGTVSLRRVGLLSASSEV